MASDGQRRLALDHYSRYSFLPDAKEPLDRWFQLPDGRTAEEVRYFNSLARDLMPELALVVDPLCGAGSAGVAARIDGLAFRGFDGYPPRSLFALAKCRSCDVDRLRTVAQRTETATDAASALRYVAETWPDDRSLFAIIAACRVARMEIPAGPSFGELLGWIIEDLEKAQSDQDLDVSCLDVRDDSAGVLDDRPAAMITAPPHPLTRGVFRDGRDPAIAEAVDALRRLDRYQGRVEEATSAGLVPAIFQFAVSRFPQLRVAIVEFDDPPNHPSGAQHVIDVGRAYGFEWVETIVTYEATPDGRHKGGGGQVLLRR